MENLVVLVILALVGLTALRLLLIPMGLLWKLLLHSVSGLLCLWILNSVSDFTGIFLPLNAVTVLTAGLLGVPGLGLLALLEG